MVALRRYLGVSINLEARKFSQIYYDPYHTDSQNRPRFTENSHLISDKTVGGCWGRAGPVRTLLRFNVLGEPNMLAFDSRMYTQTYSSSKRTRAVHAGSFEVEVRFQLWLEVPGLTELLGTAHQDPLSCNVCQSWK